ncbi:MAG TPA: primosomal protein N', partial [bacterium]|nr:primosomal protein N' [bacterium]
YYRASLGERRAFGYPPFGRLAALLFKGEHKEQVQAAAEAAAEQLLAAAKARKLPCEVLGPAPAPIVLVKSSWRYRLLLKSPSSQALHQLLSPWCFAWKDRRAQLAVDIDPLSFL